MFSTPESARISDTWTAVRILGGDDMDAAGEAFMRRYGVGAFPTLMAVTARGDLVDADLTARSARTADGLFAAMRKADQAHRAFLAERARVETDGDATSRRALAKRLVERRDLEGARKLLERVADESPGAEVSAELAQVLRATGDVAAERAVLESMVATWRDHAERASWRIRLATLYIAPPTTALGAQVARSETLDALEGLQRALAAEGDRFAEARVRLELAALAFRSGRAPEAEEHIAWIQARSDDEARREARLLQAEAAMERRRLGDARKHAEAVVAAGPESAQAARAHLLLGDLAYGDRDQDAVRRHFAEVVRLAPDTPMADLARKVLRSLERRPAPPR